MPHSEIRASSEPGAVHLLADVSGFTSFLSDVADAHAGDTDPSFVPAAYGMFGGLIDLVVGSVAPPFDLAKLEGDAVFAVASSDTVASLDSPPGYSR